MDMLKYINRYEAKTGGDFVKDWDLKYYPFIFMWDTGEFMTWGYYGDYIDIGPSSVTDWKKAWDKLKVFGAICKVKKFITHTTRNPKAYARLTNSKFHFNKDEDQYVIEKEAD